MLNEKIFKKLTKVIGEDTMASLQDLSIYQDDGGYHLFNQYTITKKNNMFEIVAPSVITPTLFYTLKNAVAWCIFDKRIKVSECKRILALDNRLAGIDTDILQHQHLVKTTKNTDDKLIFLAKLGEDRHKRKEMISELDGYIQESKNWQTKRFNTKP